MRIVKLINNKTNEVGRIFLEKDLKSFSAKNGILTINFKEGGVQSVPTWAYRLEAGKQ